MNRSTRKITLDTLVGDKVITPEGKNWFIEATDPFHDNRVTLTGYPDTNVAASLVQCVKKTQTFMKPSALPAGNWDTNIVLWPNPVQFPVGGSNQIESWACSTVTTGRAGHINQDVNNTNSGTIQPYHLGGVSAFSAKSGDPTYGTSDVLTTDGTALSLGLDESYLTGSARVIGMGFEVVNTTSQLYKQGQVTCYRQPTPDCSRMPAWGLTKVQSGPSYYQGYGSVYSLKQPPATQQQAMLLEGTVQWGAEDGCYAIATMNSMHNPAKQSEPQLIVSWQDDWSQQTGPGLGIGTKIQVFGGWANYAVTPVTHIAPYNLSGAYFTGLSPETTLSVTVVWYIQRFPDPFETDLSVIAYPSPGYDPMALELYARAMKHLPVAVKQGDNPLGEWFKSVASKVAKVAAPVLKTIAPAHPALGMLATGAQFADQVLNTGNGGKKKAKPAKTQKVKIANAPPPVQKAPGKTGPGKKRK